MMVNRRGITLIPLALVLVLSLGSVPGAKGQDYQIEDRVKLAQTSMQFLSVSVDARASAMGNAMTAQEVTSTALFYNPASMAWAERSFDVGLGQNQWFADITHNVGSMAFRPGAGQYGTFGLSVRSVNYGEALGTIRADNEQGFIETGSYSPSAMATGVGYARSVTTRFSVGAQFKYVRQSLGSSVMGFDDTGDQVVQDNKVGTMAVDFGAIYRTGFRSLNFAVSARNFSSENTYERESFELPLTFRMGLSMDMIDLTDLNSNTHQLLLAADGVHSRDYKEHVQVGGEYLFMNTLALRAGYIHPSSEQGLSLGVGLQQSISGFGVGFDYAYSEFGALGTVNRLSMQLEIE